MLLTWLILSTFSAHAGAPQKYVRCADNIRIPSVPNSQGLYFDETCKTAYVLPPAVGKMTISGISTNVNSAYCEPILNDIEVVRHLDQRISKLVRASEPLPQGDGPLGRWGNNPSTADEGLSETKLKELSNLYQLRISILEGLGKYKNYEGGTAKILIELPSTDLVESYRTQMQDITVTGLPLEGSYLSFAPAFQTGELRAVLATNVPGLQPTMENGGFKLDPEVTTMGQALSGQIQLSVAGACQFYDPINKTLNVKGSKNIAANLNANFIYSYNLQVRAHYKAQYNLAAAAKKLKEAKSSGGFFDSKTVTSFLEGRNTEEWFTFKGEFEDPSMDAQELERTVKLDLIDRIFKNAKSVGYLTSDAGLNPLAPKAHGATVAANELAKCPNVYCQIASGVSKFADAVFGSDKAMDNWISENNFWGSEDVTSDKPFRYFGSSSFTSPN